MLSFVHPEQLAFPPPIHIPNTWTFLPFDRFPNAQQPLFKYPPNFIPLAPLFPRAQTRPRILRLPSMRSLLP